MAKQRLLVMGAVAGVTVLVVGVAFTVGYRVGAGTGQPPGSGAGGDDALSVITQAYREIHSRAVHPPDPDELARGAVRGMVHVLQRATGDRYAAFYPPKGLRSIEELTSGHFSGIGVWVRDAQRGLEVVSVLPGSPAQAAGIHRTDVIRRIDGRPVSELTTGQAVSAIKGSPGSRVSLSVERHGRRLGFRVRRATIELPNEMSRMVAGDLGYIHLFGFARGAGRQVHRDVARLKARGAKGVILDLRDNGGGLFSEGVRVASDFLAGGPVVRYERRGHPPVTYKATGRAFTKLPVVVLVNRATASAAEIVTGALKDRHRAIVVGTRTYGKGSVQQVVPLPDGTAFKLTTASYLTPDGKSINGTGIRPNVRVARPSLQLLRATQILNGMVLSSSNSRG